MRQALLISVAALALAAGSTAAMSQGAPAAAPGDHGGAGATSASPGGAGAASAPGGRNGQITESPTPGKATQDRTIPEKKSTEQVPANGKQAPVQQGQAAPAADERHEGGSQQGASERNEGSRQGANERHDGNTRQGANEHGMKSSNVSLTTEQKTTIRKTVLTSSAPRVTKVDFDVKIGVVVPRTVRVAPIPTTLITIEPEWRGYTYFVYADEIIIVNPRTLEIVAVLDV